MNYLSVLFLGNLTVCWYIFKYLFLYFEGKTYWGITRIYKSVVVRPILDSCLSAFLCLEQRIRIATVGRYSGISWRKQAGGTVSVVRFCTNWITVSWIDGQHVLSHFCWSSKPWGVQTLIPSDWSLCTKNLLSISERITAPLPHGSNIRTVTGYYTGKSVRVPNNLWASMCWLIVLSNELFYYCRR